MLDQNFFYMTAEWLLVSPLYRCPVTSMAGGNIDPRAVCFSNALNSYLVKSL